MNDLIQKVLAWGAARGLHDTDDLRGQMTKLTEELGEIAAGVARDDRPRIMDGIGDLLVVLINFGAVYDKSLGTPIESSKFFLEDCLKGAWDQIENRKGKTVNGIFVKNESNEEEL
jgi:NTP pyrophosphatase (non-canonical NTP hydrolase)